MSEGINIDLASEIKALDGILIADQKISRNQEVWGVISNMRDIVVPHTEKRDSSRFFTLVDPSTGISNGRKIQSFHAQKEYLPVGNVGDIMICRGLTLSIYQGETRGVLSTRYFSASWTTLSIHDLEPIQNSNQNFVCSDKDLGIAKVLQKWYKESGGPLPDKPAEKEEGSIEKPPKTYTYYQGKPFLTTKEIGENNFPYCNFIGLYLGCRYATVTKTLALTDFTPNPHPGNNTSPYNGISRELIMWCTLWDEHAEKCPDLERGDYVMIVNGRRKITKQNIMEISIHGDVLSAVHTLKVIKLSPDDKRLADIKLRAESANEHSKMVPKTESVEIKPKNLLCTDSINLREPRSVISTLDILPLTTFIQMQTEGVIGNHYKIRGCVTDFRSLDPADWFLQWCKNCERYFKRTLKTCMYCNNTLNDLKYRFCLFLEDARGDQLHIFCIGNNIASISCFLGL
ncbi:hypothetical protein CLU79DRAFT_837270 [Phycomyces nitens]|nr:hypothetical protein CLU79DRAFT_837270 [Phycomyces nitens]